MAQRKRRPGSPKGQPKPAPRVLDGQFAERLRQAMERHKEFNNAPALAKEVKCTRAVIHKYLNGNSKTIEAILLFMIAEVLHVAPGWLLLGEGEMTPAALDPRPFRESAPSIHEKTNEYEAPPVGKRSV